MASTSVDICNAALIKVGAETITALSDNNKRARACNERYADIRDVVLAAHPWNFAIGRTQLVDISGFIKNGRFTTGITNWTDSSAGSSSISWNSTDKNLTLSAVATDTAIASQAFTLTATTTVKLQAKMVTTDSPLAANNYIAIGTTAGAVDSLQVFFTGITGGETVYDEVELAAGTYYASAGTINGVSGTYTTEIDDFSVKDTSGLNDIYDLSNRFELPSDFLKLIDIHQRGIAYKVQGNELLCPLTEVKIRYIKQVTDVTLFEPLFVEALACRIGSELALHLVDSDSRKQLLEAIYDKQLRTARFNDSLQGSPDDLPDGNWLDSRRGS